MGTTSAELMERLEDEYGEDETAELLEVLVVASVRTRKPPTSVQEHDDDADYDAPDEERSWTYVHLRSSEDSWTRQLGLAAAAVLSIEERTS